MNKIVLFLILLGLVSKSQITFAQTQYTGIANVHFVQSSDPSNCGINASIDTAYPLHYEVFQPSSQPNSIIYEIFVGGSINGVYFQGDSSKIAYLKNDADLIVFPFVFHIDHTLHGQIGDGCHAYEQYWDYTGIERISATTAGVTTKKNNALDFGLFPNPTTGLLKIKANANNAIVIDCLGRVASSQKIEAHDNVEFSTLDVSSLPAGCYTLVLDEGMKKITAKFIKY